MHTTNIATLLLVAVLTLAPMSRGHTDDDDHDLARRAVEQGRALPLADLVAKVTAQTPGKVIEVELEDEDGKLVYDLKMLSPQGQLQEIEVDAATGNILKIEDDD